VRNPALNQLGGAGEGERGDGSPSHTPKSPSQTVVELWDTIPGIDELAVSTLAAAEMGPGMNQFPSAGHAAKMTGICPGNKESGGEASVRKNDQGQRWLRRALCQAAWAASRTKDTYLAAQYHHLIVRKGKKKTIVAVAHTMLIIAYYNMAQRQCTYQELGGDYFNRLKADNVKFRMVQKLWSLGFEVTLTSIAPVSPELSAQAV
jgi:transposase